MRSSKHILLCVLAGLVCLSACKKDEPESPVPGQKVARMAKSSKRGVAFNFNHVSDLPLLSPYITWDYNWGNTTSDNSARWFDVEGIDFCPMCWNGNYNTDAIRAYVATHPKTKYLLAFNEPNLTDQANMTPTQAAALWQPVVALAKELNLKLVSPAMNYGTLSGYNDPVKWLDEFFAQPQVSIDDIYAIAVHCYMSSPNAVKDYIEKFRKYGKPVWLTEFCAWDPKPSSEETQINYMSTVLDYLECEPLVARYAWFIPRYTGGNDPYMRLITNADPGELTAAGKVYCGFSSFDKNSYLNTEWISAGSYCAREGNVPSIRPNTDAQVANLDLPLMITNAGENMSMEYHVVLPDKASSIAIRTTGYANATVRIWIDDQEVATTSVAATKGLDNWTSTSCAIDERQRPSAGGHTVRLEWLSGNCLYSAFRLR